jgi:predicted secreted protein
MATTAPAYGKDIPLKIGSTSTTTQIINLTANSASFTTDMREVTTKDSGTYREHRPTFHDAEFGFDGLYTSTASAQGFEDLLTFKEAKTEIFWEIGSGVSGSPKWTGKGYITNLDVDFPMEDNVTFTGTVKNTGDVTVSTYA